MNKFKTCIGIEIHIELNTKTKMFSASPNVFSQEPNTNVNEVDIGYPGTLPQLNKEAVISAIKLAKSLKMEIDDELHFDRKHYFYPDLSKGFQITQYNRPIGKNGIIIIKNKQKKQIKIQQIHLEEDTAKSIHKNQYTLLDYNRAGTPLIEIVSCPNIANSQEAIDYVMGIKNILLALNISNAKMEEGSLRVDINISLMLINDQKMGQKIEIKNLNSFANIKKAIDFEIKLQTKMLLNNEQIQQITKRFDEKTQKTILMRNKINAIDYKYFPEPNIPIIKLSKEFINNIKIPKLPWEMEKEYQNDKIPQEFIDKLLKNLTRAKFFNSIKYKNKTKLAKVFFAEIVPLEKKIHKSLYDLNVDTKQIQIAMEKIDNGEISKKHLKIIIPQLINKTTIEEIIKKENIKQISNKKILQKIIINLFDENQDFINENSNRQERIFKFILGKVMKVTNGNANPIIANTLVKKHWRKKCSKKIKNLK